VLASEGVLNVAVLHGKLADGAGQHAPFDVIILQGAVEEIPQILLEQLNDGGRIAAIFNQRGHGAVRVGHKSNGHLSWRFAFNAFSPMLPGFEKHNDFTL
jgi:protein-L-isoaspartate(D-aspartate) O-methyltransferase